MILYPHPALSHELLSPNINSTFRQRSHRVPLPPKSNWPCSFLLHDHNRLPRSPHVFLDISSVVTNQADLHNADIDCSSFSSYLFYRSFRPVRYHSPLWPTTFGIFIRASLLEFCCIPTRSFSYFETRFSEDIAVSSSFEFLTPLRYVPLVDFPFASSSLPVRCDIHIYEFVIRKWWQSCNGYQKHINSR